MLKFGCVGMNPGEYKGGDVLALIWFGAGGARNWVEGEQERLGEGSAVAPIWARSCCI